MPSLKAIRKRISSVKSTQKITRAMKMVAGARLARAQMRITQLRPYAIKTEELLGAIVASHEIAHTEDDAYETADERAQKSPDHPLLAVRPEKRILLLVMTSDRGLCGALNTNINRAAERTWKSRTSEGQEVQIYTVGRKGKEYLRRRGAPVVHDFTGVWEKLDIERARLVAKTVIAPFLKGEIDAIYVLFSEFKSAMTQKVVMQQLLPVPSPEAIGSQALLAPAEASEGNDYIFEPNKPALLEQLVPMYVETAILRALLESMASELGARMSAMDSATKNAKEMIGSLTLVYNRARQAAITKELMEIIGGAEALKE